jgi:hypothetical protein
MDERETLKRSNALTLVLLAIALVSLGCATVGRFSDAATGQITVPVRFEDSLGNTLSVDGRPGNGTVWLGAIPGQIFGSPRTPLHTESINTSQAFTLDLDRLRGVSAQESGRINNVASDSGWKVVPTNTRILRVATDIGHDAHNSYQVNTRFADLGSTNVLILVYFDRPCQLTGTIPVHAAGQPPQTYTVNVTAENGGLHWLEVSRGATQDSRVIRHASRSVVPVLVARLGLPAPRSSAVTK